MVALVARYGGRCAAECGRRILPGDEVVYVDDDLVHLDCEGYAIARPRLKVREVCAVCRLERPCPCDDGQGAA